MASSRHYPLYPILYLLPIQTYAIGGSNSLSLLILSIKLSGLAWFINLNIFCLITINDIFIFLQSAVTYQQLKIHIQQQVMSWRQGSLSPRDPQDSVAQISKLRLENTRIKIQAQSLRSEIEPYKNEVQRITKVNSQLKQKQSRVTNSLIRLCIILNINQQFRNIEDTDIISLIEKRIVQQKQKNSKMQKELNKYNILKNNERDKVDVAVWIKKSQQIEEQNKINLNKIGSLQQEIIKMRGQIEDKSNMLGELGHKLTQAEIQLKESELELGRMKGQKNNQQKQKLKRQCHELLNQINIRDDDYLKSYILKNQRYKNTANNVNSVSRKNKYDFVFQQ